MWNKLSHIRRKIRRQRTAHHRCPVGVAGLLATGAASGAPPEMGDGGIVWEVGWGRTPNKTVEDLLSVAWPQGLLRSRASTSIFVCVGVCLL